MNKFRQYLICGVIALGSAACDRTPDYVIKPDDMADLLVDIHKGEGVIDLNSASYRNDSLQIGRAHD